MSRYGGDRGYSPPRGGPERWDRERFERTSRGGPPVMERDIRYEEVDRYGPPPPRQDEFFVPRPPAAPRFEERDRVVFEEKFSRGPRGGRYYDLPGNDVEGAELVPYERRRESFVERDYGPSRTPARPQRPVFVRRQSSLDTFDRKPMPRYGDRMREPGPPPPPPEIIPISTGRRQRSPPRYVERTEIDEIRVQEPEYPYREEEFEGYIERERSTVRKRNPPHGEVVEEFREEIIEREAPRRGKTRMPMRLINKRAVIELGYPFEEEGDTLIILKALGKDHIDEVISISREYNAQPKVVEETRTTYAIEAPPRAPSTHRSPSPPAKKERIIERVTEVIREGSPGSDGTSTAVPESVKNWDKHSKKSMSHHRSPSPAASTATSKSTLTVQPRKGRHRSRSEAASMTREIIIENDVGESSNDMTLGPVGALIVPERSRRPRDEADIKAEIRALEAEKKALKYEREADRALRNASRYREGGEVLEVVRAGPRRVRGDELIIADRGRDELIIEERVSSGPEVAVKRDRKGRLALVAK